MTKKNLMLTVTDPSDWLATQIPALKELDDSLRCHICKDFATAPMLATCCEHTFCSLCIRRQFANTHKCPMCARPVGSENHVLKKNRELELAIEAFVDIRAQLFGLLTKPEIKKEDQQDSSSQQQQIDKEEENDDVEIIEEVRNPSLVPCPVCNKFFTVTEIEKTHLASCLSGTDSKNSIPSSFKPLSKSTTASTSSVQTSIFTQSPSSRRQYTKLPKPGTTNIKLRDLKTRLQKLGIPSHGTQAELVQREAEWITLWNANCDARRPKPKSMLLRDLDATMRDKQIAEAGGLDGGNTTTTTATGASKKRKYTAESARAYSKRENATFKELTKRARASFKKKGEMTEDTDDKTEPRDTDVSATNGNVYNTN